MLKGQIGDHKQCSIEMKDVCSMRGKTIVLSALSKIGYFYRKQLARARGIKSPTHVTQKRSTVKLLEILNQVCDERIKRVQTNDGDQIEILSNPLTKIDSEVLVMAEALVQEMLMDVMEFDAEEKEASVLEELEKVEEMRQVLAQLAKDSVKLQQIQQIGNKHEEIRALHEELAQDFFRPFISSTNDHPRQQYPETSLRYALETLQELQKEISLIKEENIQLTKLLDKTKTHNRKGFNTRQQVPYVRENHKIQDTTVLRMSDLFEDTREQLHQHQQEEANNSNDMFPILDGSPIQAIDLLRTQLTQHQVSCVDILHDHILQLEAALREADEKLLLFSNSIDTLHGSSSATTSSSSYTNSHFNSSILALQSDLHQLQGQLSLKTLALERSEKEYEQLREESASFHTTLVTYKTQQENLRQIMLELSQEKKGLFENLEQMKRHCRQLEAQVQEYKSQTCEKEVQEEQVKEEEKDDEEESVIVTQQQQQQQQQEKEEQEHLLLLLQQQQEQQLIQIQEQEEKIITLENALQEKEQAYQDVLEKERTSIDELYTLRLKMKTKEKQFHLQLEKQEQKITQHKSKIQFLEKEKTEKQQEEEIHKKKTIDKYQLLLEQEKNKHKSIETLLKNVREEKKLIEEKNQDLQNEIVDLKNQIDQIQVDTKNIFATTTTTAITSSSTSTSTNSMQLKLSEQKQKQKLQQEFKEREVLLKQQYEQTLEEILEARTKQFEYQEEITREQLKQTQSLVEIWKDQSKTIEVQKKHQIHSAMIYLDIILKQKSDEMVQQMQDKILQQHFLPLYERMDSLKTQLKKLKAFHQRKSTAIKHHHQLYLEEQLHENTNHEDSGVVVQPSPTKRTSSSFNQDLVKPIVEKLFHQIQDKGRQKNKIQEENLYAHINDAFTQLYVTFFHNSSQQQQENVQVFKSKQNSPTKTSKTKRLGSPLKKKSPNKQLILVRPSTPDVPQQELQPLPLLKMNTKISVNVATNTDSSMVICTDKNKKQVEKHDASTNTFKAPCISRGTSTMSTKMVSFSSQSEVPVAVASCQTALLEVEEAGSLQVSTSSNYWKWERLVFGSMIQNKRSNLRKTQMKCVAEEYHASCFKELVMKQNSQAMLLKKQHALFLVFFVLFKRKLKNSRIRAFFHEWKNLPSYSEVATCPVNVNVNASAATREDDDQYESRLSSNDLSTTHIGYDATAHPSMEGTTVPGEEINSCVNSQPVQPPVPSPIYLDAPPASVQLPSPTNHGEMTTERLDDFALSHAWVKWHDAYHEIEQHLMGDGATESDMQKFLDHCAELAHLSLLEPNESSPVLTTFPSPRSMSKNSSVPSLFSPVSIKDELKNEESSIHDGHQLKTVVSLSEGKSLPLNGSTSADKINRLSDELCSMCHKNWIRALNNERRRMNMENVKILEEVVKSLQTAQESHTRLAAGFSLQSNKLHEQEKLHEQTKAFLLWKYSTFILRLRSSYLNCSVLLFPDEDEVRSEKEDSSTM